MSITKKLFETLPGAQEIHQYTIENKNRMQVCVLDYAGTIQAMLVPDKSGKLRDVIVGSADIKGHKSNTAFFGKIIGRYANRIAGAKFSIDGEEYNVTANERDMTCLHGGNDFSDVIWDAQIIDEHSLKLSYTSPDGKNGFPGEMKTQVTYTLSDDNSFEIFYEAVCSKDTFINLTNHAYFNLSGGEASDVLEHQIKINADFFTPIDEFSIPTGEIKSVKGTAFDFTSDKTIGQDIAKDDEQLVIARGYDHNFCINQNEDAPAVSVYEPLGGIEMNVYTDLPGVQFYTGNFLDGEPGKYNGAIGRNAGFCLETQYYPDTPNRPDFPQCLIKAGETFKTKTIFNFGFKK